jgi:hypothetical protein
LFSKPLPVTQLRRVIAEPIFPVFSQPKRVASLADRSRRAAS